MKAFSCLVLFALAATALAFYPYYNPYDYGLYSYDRLLERANLHGYSYLPYTGGFSYRYYYPDFFPLNFYYYGAFPGKCGADGLYYNDERSFVICSNGIDYVQPCAPGSRNAPLGQFAQGSYYGYGDFCGVNVNDQGITN